MRSCFLLGGPKGQDATFNAVALGCVVDCMNLGLVRAALFTTEVVAMFSESSRTAVRLDGLQGGLTAEGLL